MSVNNSYPPPSSEDTLSQSIYTRRSKRAVSALSLLIAAVVLFSGWMLVTYLINQPVLPAPTVVLQVFASEMQADLGKHLIVSLYRVISSIVLAILLAGPSGLLLGQYPQLDRLFAPIIYLIYPVPKVVLVPVVLLLLGVGDVPKITIITLILYFQILVLVRDAAANIRPETILSVRSLGAGRRALLRYVYLPASIPAILTSVRQSIGTSIAVLYIAELFATQYGLGYYIYYQGSTLFDYPKMYAGILAMGLMGLSLYFSVDAVERRLCQWCAG